MNDIDRLGTRLDELLTAVHLLSGRLSAQSQDMAALRKRIEALEGQGNPTRGAADASPRDSGSAQASGSSVVAPASPAPPAPLVERMAREFEIVPEWLASAGTVNARRAVARNLARAALLVAAEELLGEITLDEWEDACTRYGSNAPGATTNGVLRSRLARAKEAAK